MPWWRRGEVSDAIAAVTENGTTKDRSLVGASDTAKDGTKKSRLWAGAAGHNAGTDVQADGQ